MATTVTSPEAVAVKTESFDYVVYGRSVDDNGVDLKEPEFKLVKGGEDSTKYTEEKGWKNLATATVITPSLGHIDGFEILIPDPDERRAVAQRGIGQKLNQKIPPVLLDYDSNTGQLTYDFSVPLDGTEILREPTQRRNLSPLEKALRSIKQSGLSDDELSKLFAHLGAIR